MCIYVFEIKISCLECNSPTKAANNARREGSSAVAARGMTAGRGSAPAARSRPAPAPPNAALRSLKCFPLDFLRMEKIGKTFVSRLLVITTGKNKSHFDYTHFGYLHILHEATTVTK